MGERLAFGYGTSGHSGDTPAAGAAQPPASDPSPASPRASIVGRGTRSAADRGTDAAFFGLMVFTGLLFFRPQDQIPLLESLHLAELSAVGALAAMVFGRLKRGLGVSRVNPELWGVVAMGVLILATAPFSIWPSGSIATFTEIYSKIILIFVLMVNTLTSRRRIEQFVWLIVIASGYIGLRAVVDLASGHNLIENGRVQGSVGGIFKNPNDLALNMVAIMPLAVALALHAGTLVRRAGASLCAVLMLGAMVASQSRSGTIGFVVMAAVLGLYMVRQRPALAVAGVLAMVLALPLVPSSYWHRLSSITDESQDDTGSREARQTLLRESFRAFVQHPLTGVGAGQFKNYDPEGRLEPWRESHNIVLQVAAELGIAGLAVLGFLVARAVLAGIQTRRLLDRALGRRRRRGGPARERPLITPADAEWFRGHAVAMTAALAGWFFCALFASVAYNWTFYYLLALATTPREILIDRLVPPRARRAAVLSTGSLREARA